jgi:hypothetical protein
VDPTRRRRDLPRPVVVHRVFAHPALFHSAAPESRFRRDQLRPVLWRFQARVTPGSRGRSSRVRAKSEPMLSSSAIPDAQALLIGRPGLLRIKCGYACNWMSNTLIPPSKPVPIMSARLSLRPKGAPLAADTHFRRVPVLPPHRRGTRQNKSVLVKPDRLILPAKLTARPPSIHCEL